MRGPWASFYLSTYARAHPPPWRVTSTKLTLMLDHGLP